MHIGKRLETIARMVPHGSILADIGTDHAYLPVWLLKNGCIKSAIAGDIAVGPCQAARNTVAANNMQKLIQVRMGSGLEVITSGEADCITIAGMGASTIISILEANFSVAASAKLLVLQPMAGAAILRRWLCNNGWQLVDEELVDDEPHFYEIIAACRGVSEKYSEAEYFIGPVLLKKRHSLLIKQMNRQVMLCRQLLANMERSKSAKESSKYSEMKALQAALEVLQSDKNYNCK